MYVGMRSVSSNYDDFRRPVEGAIQPSIAGFGCFQCIFSLARLNNCNQPHKKGNAFLFTWQVHIIIFTILGTL